MQNFKKKPLNNFIVYSSMAFQMGFIILGSAYGGVKLDEYIREHQWFNTDFPIFTVVLSIFGLAAAMYLFLKDLMRKNK